ncbi:MAG: hypothetical protein WKF75_12755 [Singulisphaera sp.]
MSSPDPAPNLATDVLRTGEAPLGAIFAPRSVAVIGATEKAGSAGGRSSESGREPVRRDRLSGQSETGQRAGIKAYPSISDVPDRVDLAVMVTPAPGVPDLMGECVEAGVRGDHHLRRLQGDRGGRDRAGTSGPGAGRRGPDAGHRPDCLGVMNPMTGLNATFAGAMARPGNIGFLSQSGALCTAVLDWSFQANVGFSAFVSVGSMLDVGWGDLIDHLGDDPRTTSIIIYMESIGDARSFLSAAREVALTKPIIVLKAGRTEAAAKAAASHTGSLTGSDEVLEAAFRRSGVLRVDRIAELFSMAEVLALQPRPRGPRLTIVTNAGGPGVLATAAWIGGGGELAPLAAETVEASIASCPPTGATTTRSTCWATPTPAAMRRRSRSRPGTRTPTACWSS